MRRMLPATAALASTTATLREFVAADVSPLHSLVGPSESELTFSCYDTTWKSRAECGSVAVVLI